MTKIISQDHIEEAAALLQSGEVVAFPTETVYGLGASVYQESAIRKIFTVKGRPADNPLIVHISHIGQVEELSHSLPPLFYLLAERFFPGPLTVVVPKSAKVPPIVSAGLDSVAIRMPSHSIANKLISLVGSPLVAPSANLSGRPSATCAEHVMEDFRGKIPAIVDGGPCSIGIESTVISLLECKPMVLRLGGLSIEEIEDCLQQPIEIYKPVEGEAVRSPGMKYRHYAPKASMSVYTSVQQVEERLRSFPSCMVLSNQPIVGSSLVYPLESSSFYAHLRLADTMGIEEIVIFCDPVVQRQPALMHRIEKASH